MYDDEYIIHHIALQAFCLAKFKIDASFFDFHHTAHYRPVLEMDDNISKGDNCKISKNGSIDISCIANPYLFKYIYMCQIICKVQAGLFILQLFKSISHFPYKLITFITQLLQEPWSVPRTSFIFLGLFSYTNIYQIIL